VLRLMPFLCTNSENLPDFDYPDTSFVIVSLYLSAVLLLLKLLHKVYHCWRFVKKVSPSRFQIPYMFPSFPLLWRQLIKKHKRLLCEGIFLGMAHQM